MSVPPQFTKKPTLRQDGSSIVFSCEIVADPEPEITWFRGESLLSPSEHYEAIVEPKADTNTYTLKFTVKDVGPEDNGVYKVEAKNQWGQMAAGINLNLQGISHNININKRQAKPDIPEGLLNTGLMIKVARFSELKH